MGRCLKHWQLSRDNDCLVGFHLHFSTEAAAFVVRVTLQMYKTYSETMKWHFHCSISTKQWVLVAAISQMCAYLDVIIIKGTVLWRLAFSSVIYYTPPLIFLCFSLISNAQLPLICLQLLWGHTGWENTPTWPDTLAPQTRLPSYGHARDLFCFIRPPTSYVCGGLMKDNVSKSDVVL